MIDAWQEVSWLHSMENGIKASSSLKATNIANRFSNELLDGNSRVSTFVQCLSSMT